MKKRELMNLGIPYGPCCDQAIAAMPALAAAGLKHAEIRARFTALAADPAAHLGDPVLGALAQALQTAYTAAAAVKVAGNARRLVTEDDGSSPVERAEPVPWQQWGTDIDAPAKEQMRNACRLPVAVAGALMPDAHLGYGLPIGGVLATEGAVVPYAVGVDIACRMKLSVLDLPTNLLDRNLQLLQRALTDETQFGIGAEFKRPRQHPVMDADWDVTALTKSLRDKAWQQLGTSGSGNHFVEFGTLTLDAPALGLAAGTYLALLSHSGSRGAGAQVCGYYSKVARACHPRLPKELAQLAWLDLATEAGQEYWAAMSLMGEYAAANHACIHRHVAKHLGAEVLLNVENHHNFAWKEQHFGREVVVHRKGATPAGVGVLGIIPGSMATPGYLVSGRGSATALNSASHGAGRAMSRSAATERFRWAMVNPQLEAAKVTLMSAGLDEVPGVYKDIHQVMAAQTDLVDVLARFDPRLVRMAGPGERPED